jgi:glycopeptide antibiotics resistance protein
MLWSNAIFYSICIVCLTIFAIVLVTYLNDNVKGTSK